MKRFSTASCVLALLLGWPVGAKAQWSVGGSVGLPDADIDVSVYDPPKTTADDSSPFSGKLFVNCALGENVGLEAGYAYLGNEYQLFNALGRGEVVGFEPRAAFATLVGRAHLNGRVVLFAKLGAAYWHTNIEYTEGAFQSSGRDSDVDPVIGFGFEIDVSRRVAFRLEWEQFQNIGDDTSAARPPEAGSTIELGGHDISTFGVGLRVRF